MLTRADYAYGLEKAALIAREVFGPRAAQLQKRRAGAAAAQREQQSEVTDADALKTLSSMLLNYENAALKSDVMTDLNKADAHRQCKLYNKLTLVRPYMSPAYPDSLMLELELDVTQFNNPSVLTRGKRLIHGNLLALSRTWFTDPKEPILYGVIHKNNDWDDKVKNRFGPQRFAPVPIRLVLDGPSGSLDVALSVLQGFTEFQAIESEALFTPYRRVLDNLQHLARSNTGTIPMDRALLMGDTRGIPDYVQRCKKLMVGGAVLMKDKQGDGTYTVQDVNFADLVEEWTAERESELSQQSQHSTVKLHVVDSTQAQALQHIFSHRVSVVQGTPGTGKSFIGAKVIQILLETNTFYKQLNRSQNGQGGSFDCGSILLIAQTNHAVDAVLKDVLPHIDRQFALVRLGGSEGSMQQYSFATLKRNCTFLKSSRNFGTARGNVNELHERFAEIQKEMRYFSDISKDAQKNGQGTFYRFLVDVCKQQGYDVWDPAFQSAARQKIASHTNCIGEIEQAIRDKRAFLDMNKNFKSERDISAQLKRWNTLKVQSPAMLAEGARVFAEVIPFLHGFCGEDGDADDDANDADVDKDTVSCCRRPLKVVRRS